MDQPHTGVVSTAAIGRMVETFERAGIAPSQIILNGFGDAYGSLRNMVDGAARERGNTVLSPHDLLGAPDTVATCFVGSPDQLFALLRAGYGPALACALVGAGAVFPIVHTLARQHGVLLCDMMSDPFFGPYAVRSERDQPYALLTDVALDLVRVGADVSVPHGMIGEIVLCDSTGDDAPIHTGVLSRLEQVPHSYRPPGLMGWLGFAQPRLKVENQDVRSVDVATLIGEHDEVLDARLLAFAKHEAEPVLQVETEAGTWIEDDVLASFEALTGLRPNIERVLPGQFVNTGRPFAVRAA